MASNRPEASALPPSRGKVPAAQVGDVVAGKYQVQKVLGRGGMGVVVSAMHVHLRERVALKVLLPSRATDRESRARFLREARVTARLQNEHIAQVMDVGVLDDGSPYFVMEYLEGIDLKRLLARHGPLDVALAVNFVAQACEGVAEAHARGVLHRDLKPSNLLLTKRYDGSDLIKVLDFGVSKARLLDADDSYHTVAGTVLGSPAYMAPERLEEEPPEMDARADVWSLGVILYELLAGQPPYWDASPVMLCANVLAGKPYAPLRSHRGGVPPALEEAISRALRHNQKERTPDVAALVAELLQALPNESKATGRVSVDRMRATLDRPPTSHRETDSSGLADRYTDQDDHAAQVDATPTLHEQRPITPALKAAAVPPLPTESVDQASTPSPQNRTTIIVLVIILMITIAAFARAILMQ